jgi:D-lactate dehydrogenase (cytochrome)
MDYQWETVTKEYQDYLRDESRSVGHAEYISFPDSEEALVGIMKQSSEENLQVTVQGARTGISAGAVPQGGLILNLSRMNRVLGMEYDEKMEAYTLRVQPGVILSELREMLENKSFDSSGWAEYDQAVLKRFQEDGDWFFPPDPTEASASIGGMIACNASGARSFHFGPVREYVQGLRVVTAQGDMIALERDRERANDHAFALTSESGHLFQGALPEYPWPKVKNASGYYTAAGMDLLDLFIGSEGTLGVVAEACIRLIREPAAMWSMTAFFPDEESAVTYVEKMKKAQFPGAYTAALEYFNSRALDFLREQRKQPAFAAIPEMPPEFHTAIYTEIHGDDEDTVSEAMMAACEVLVEVGGDDEMTWIATNPREMEKLHFFRHATPEAVNLCIDERRKSLPALTKLGTDMAVPDASLIKVLEMYNRTLSDSGLEWVMFGHIGDNHIHVNILPNSLKEYEQGKKMYQEWAEAVIAMGGTVSAEHGIGKLKARMLRDMYGYDGMAMMAEVKKVFDPAGRLNPGSIFGV